ncbi:Ankyrin repeat-containing protein 27 [Elsinoe fawcettii]|nr:Ankyrin repeat-containing protein 27 [Elsinoe fawcettii]
MSSPAPDRSQFTVGWICALVTEYVAAALFLDLEYNSIDWKSVSDNNDYTLGRVGNHNVVIAVCPNDEHGIASATSVARDMLHTFPHIRIGVLVGIGGGMPSAKHDIRLGDVVVSSAVPPRPAVVKFDRGRKRQGDNFEVTSLLDNPPTILRTAVSGLQSAHKRSGNGLQDMIEAALQGADEDLRDEYKKPDASTDVLYTANFTHIANSDSVTGLCCLVEDAVVVQRTPRRANKPVAIHYGPIGSADQVVKDAHERDRLSDQLGILCCEMEAGGLMNNWPCLVIRGVSDYADSHKNKRWQCYADGVDEQVCSRCAWVTFRISHIHRGVNELHQARLEEKYLAWLQPANVSSNFNKALSHRHGQTGEWFLNHQAFRNWQSRSKSFLWLHGISGCGKTVLSSTILSSLSQRETGWKGVLYFYFDFADTGKQTLENAVRSLLSQSASQDKKQFEILQDLWQKCDQGRRQPNLRQPCEAFQRQLSHAAETWLVLDGLAESTYESKIASERSTEWLKYLRSADSNIHILVTSRPESEIKLSIESWAKREEVMTLQGDQVTRDIDAYINAVVADDLRLQRWQHRSGIQNEIRKALSENARGMFRWVTCQLDMIANCKDPTQLRATLNHLPTDLAETYHRMMSRIGLQDRKSAIRLLQFLLFSARPIRLDEAVDLLIVRTGDDAGFDSKDRLPRAEEITSFCPGLIVITPIIVEPDEYVSYLDRKQKDEKELVVQLAHSSVQEYLRSEHVVEPFKRKLDSDTSYSCLTRVCLVYLQHYDSHLGYGDNRPASCARYCARYWTIYARHILDKDSEVQLVKRFLTPASIYRCLRLYNLGIPLHHTMRIAYMSPLLYAAITGLRWMVEVLIDGGADVNATHTDYGNALKAAAAHGREAIVKLLLREGADAHGPGDDQLYTSAVDAAIDGRHLEVARLILEGGADALGIIPEELMPDHGGLRKAASRGDVRTVQLLLDFITHNDDTSEVEYQARGEDETKEAALRDAARVGSGEVVKLLLTTGVGSEAISEALYFAVSHWQTGVVRVLLEAGAKVNARVVLIDALSAARAKMSLLDSSAFAPIKAATLVGNGELVELLLDRGIPISQHHRPDGDALQAAILGENCAVVRMLLETGADVNAVCHYQESYLISAAREGNKEILELLINAGAHMNKQYDVDEDKHDETDHPLQMAAFWDREEAVRLLIERGTYTGTDKLHIDKAFFWAASRVHTAVAQLLLDTGADINVTVTDVFTETALQAAVSNGHSAVVELLCARGAKVDAGRHGFLEQAALFGHYEIVKSLVRAGADVNAVGEYGEHALAAAARRGHESIVELLLIAGADINRPDRRHGSALAAAALCGKSDLVNFLLTQGAHVNSGQEIESRGSPLAAAVYAGDLATVEVLLHAGANVEAGSDSFGKPLFEAALRGHKDVAEYLLIRGAGADSANCRQVRPLWGAAIRGHTDIARLLLDGGADVNAINGGQESDEQDVNYGHGSALYAAVYKGNDEVAELLLTRGADVNEENVGGSLLAMAVRNNDEAMVALLLTAEAEFKPSDSDSLLDDTTLRSCFDHASRAGHGCILRLLLRAGPEFNITFADQYDEALVDFAFHGQAHMVKQLLFVGAYVYATRGLFRNALEAAVSPGDPETIETLMTVKRWKRRELDTALHIAIVDRQNEAVAILLRCGASPDAKGGNYDNVLLVAVRQGSREMVRYLVDAGANIRLSGNQNATALYVAAYRGHHEIVDILLCAGANTEVRSPSGQTPLQVAAHHRHIEAVKLLLAFGAKVNTKGCAYGTTLYAAAIGGSVEVVSLLLEMGIDIHPRSHAFRAIITAADVRGHKEVVDLLRRETSDFHTWPSKRPSQGSSKRPSQGPSMRQSQGPSKTERLGPSRLRQQAMAGCRNLTRMLGLHG